MFTSDNKLNRPLVWHGNVKKPKFYQCSQCGRFVKIIAGGQMERNTPGGGIRKLEDKVSQLEGKNTGQLNPDWVEWLMGFPIGWTSLTKSPVSQPESKTGLTD
jgi:hypothetical protein